MITSRGSRSATAGTTLRIKATHEGEVGAILRVNHLIIGTRVSQS